MSTLSERLARLRATGKAPSGAKKAAGRSPDSPADITDSHDRIDTSGSGTPAGASHAFGSGESVGRIVSNLRHKTGTSHPARPSSAHNLRNIHPPGQDWNCIGEFVWERRLDYPAVLPLQFQSGFILPPGTAAEGLIFYDLETTGLSGGAGNTAFLIGLGYQRGDVFTVIQLFLADYPGEAVMLEHYAGFITEEMPQISYNGRSFDSQVLKTRFLLNRMPPPSAPQVDLLYPARRLWKAVLPNVTLGTLEKEVLGVFREDDLPGREAPDAWFSWLEGDAGRIEGVFQHNADDIVSLARLSVRMEEWGRLEPERFVAAGGSGKDLEKTGNSVGIEDDFTKACRSVGEKAGVNVSRCSDGNTALPEGILVSPWGMARQWAFRDAELERSWLEAGWSLRNMRCGRELAVRLRREGAYSAARIIWETINTMAGGRDFHAAVELAKDWEHRRKNPEKALEVLCELDNVSLTDCVRRALEHRRERLLGKIKRILQDE